MCALANHKEQKERLILNKNATWNLKLVFGEEIQVLPGCDVLNKKKKKHSHSFV